ncbi:restriction endonuclease subunit S [Oceanobacillus picturae]|uniref:restriction endonuclease subunit S n=1 Tax=Oceanobacillus picturae TaxID=171693 RepID=UPI000E69E1B1|nr:restriction endonuclease subunit S [Oceanobacillus picturae]RIU93433.1 restriction endonuclease subunit S [Oceanobacillus picturae]
MSEVFPSKWKVSKLSDLGISYSGLKSKSKKDFDENGNALFVTYRNINRNYFVDKNDLAPVHVESTENQNSVKRDDVLFTGSSETPEEVAFSSVMKDEMDNLYLNSFCFGYRFKDNDNTLSDFYAYFFRSEYFRKKVFPLAQGSTRYNLSRNQLLKLEVPVPSVKEQQKIAAILSSVDEAIEKTEQIIEQTETVKKGLMQELLTKGIGHTEFKESPVGKIPSDWKVDYLEELAKITTGNKDTKDKIEKGEYPFFVRSQIVENINSYSFDGEAILTAGDGVGVGKVFHYINGKFDYHQRVYKLSDFKEINGKFLFYYFKMNFYKQVNRFNAKTSVDSVRREMITKMIIPLPTLNEQVKIVEVLDTVNNRIDKEIQEKNNLQLLKKGLMQQLLTGKVRVPINENEEVPL